MKVCCTPNLFIFSLPEGEVPRHNNAVQCLLFLFSLSEGGVPRHNVDQLPLTGSSQ
jgi:hypothetical protein